MVLPSRTIYPSVSAPYVKSSAWNSVNIRSFASGLIKHPALKLLQTTSSVRISSIVLFAFKGFDAQVLVKVGRE